MAAFEPVDKFVNGHGGNTNPAHAPDIGLDGHGPVIFCIIFLFLDHFGINHVNLHHPRLQKNISQQATEPSPHRGMDWVGQQSTAGHRPVLFINKRFCKQWF